MAIDINQLAERIADAVEAAPELAQQLVENPVATVERITGVTGGYALTELFGLCLARLAEAGVDLSAVDLGKLDLSAIDVSRLSPDELLGLAARLNVDVSKLDMAAIASKVLGAGGLGGAVVRAVRRTCGRAAPRRAAGLPFRVRALPRL